ncbi:MAG TPA: DUF6734 family protein [Terracidiphilus sp.]|jgi:hypothetical protein|nr:DUF6734 family protein [Terracidiphilus sp.]
MRVVWSFWSKPFNAYKGRIWREPRHHLMAWGLSLSLARRHFAETQLVTDSEGRSLLVDELGLRFDHVSTDLDRLADANPGWWALGKLVAYSIQDRPFVHLDTDVFLWKALPAWLVSAPVFAQCPEVHAIDHAWCGPRDIENLFDRHGTPLPVEWRWATSRDNITFQEENCGILGANRIDFLRYYAETAIQLVLDPAHRPLWNELPDLSGFNMLVEQFLLSACLEYHSIHPQSPFRGVGIRHLFPTWSESFNADAAARLGFTHLIGDTKSHPAVAARLERRVAKLDPKFLLQCQRVAQSTAAVEA